MPLTGPDLRRARIRAGFDSTESFATALGASLRAVQDWELGKSTPQPRYREKIDAVLQEATRHAANPAAEPLAPDVIEAALTQATPMQLLTALAKLLSRLDPSLDPSPSLPEQPLRWPRTEDGTHLQPPKEQKDAGSP